MKRAIPLFLLLFCTALVQAQCFTQLCAGSRHAIALKEDGTLWAWGNNYTAQLGNSTWGFVATEQQVGTDTDWVFISAGPSYNMAIKANGTLWGWGDGYAGEIGIGTNALVVNPTQVGSDTNWAYVSCGDDYTLAIKADGSLWGWGYNGYITLGNNSSAYSTVPVRAGTDNDWAKVAAGAAHAIALKADGTLWGWGTNFYGVLGNGTSPDVGDPGYFTYAPQQIGTAADWKYISAGMFNSAAIKNNNTLWVWGQNYLGTIGNGTTAPVLVPQQAAAGEWLSVAFQKEIFSGNIMALRQDGTLWMSGSNGDGQLGNGTAANTTTLTQIALGGPVLHAALGGTWVIASLSNEMAVWGNNDYGQLGNGSQTSYLSPLYRSCDALYVPEIQYKNQLVYPNPTTTALYFSGNEIPEKIYIYNVAGTLLLTVKGKTQIDVAQLPAGVYVLKIETSAGTQTQKFIKQ